MIGQWEKLFTPSTPFLMTPSSGESIGLAALRIMRVFQANRSSTFVWRGFPRDFFSVANNLGDSVAFNLESDSFCGKNAVCREFGKTIVFSNRSLKRSYTILLSCFQDLLMLLGQTIYVLRPLQLRRLKKCPFSSAPHSAPNAF
jgi:hypothetical protein